MLTLTSREQWELERALEQRTGWLRSDENPLLWLRVADPDPERPCPDEEGNCWCGASEHAWTPMPGYGLLFGEGPGSLVMLSVITEPEDLLRAITEVETFVNDVTGRKDRLRAQEILAGMEIDEPGEIAAVLFDIRGVDGREVGTFRIEGGGYVALRQVGDAAQVILSIPSHESRPMSFGPTLRGVVRAADGNTEIALASIRGEGK
jgi:hypothetical protein